MVQDKRKRKRGKEGDFAKKKTRVGRASTAANATNTSIQARTIHVPTQLSHAVAPGDQDASAEPTALALPVCLFFFLLFFFLKPPHLEEERKRKKNIFKNPNHKKRCM